MPDEKPTPRKEVEFKLNFRIPGRMPAVYAQHMFVQPGLNEYLLTFFEVIPPLLSISGEPSEEQVKALQESGIVAECVSRIIIPKALFPSFVKAMQTGLEQGTTPEGDAAVKDANSTRDNPEG